MAPALVAVAVLGLSACAAAPPEVAVTPLAAGDVPAPSRLPGELTRTVLTGTSNDLILENRARGTGDLVVHALCTGPTGSTMRYRLLDRDEHPVAFSGTVACTGQETVSGAHVEGPARITSIDLRPSSLTGTEGWAVLSTAGIRE